MLMSAELKACVTWFIYFLDLLYVRYNCAKSHHCRICVTTMSTNHKGLSWVGLGAYSRSIMLQKSCFICFKESHLKIMKNAFYFMLKALEIFTFLLWLFGYVEKRLDKKAKANLKIHDVANWITNIYIRCLICQEVNATRQWNLVS